MRIELPPELESALVSAARRQGTTPDMLAQPYLRERLDVPSQEGPGTKPKNLAEFLAGYIGVLAIENDGQGRNNLSEDTGRRFTEALSRRTAEGPQ